MNSSALASIVSAVADRTAQQVATSTVECLQRQRSALAGADSGLGNVWLEFCAQVQGEQSFDWDEFETLVQQTVEGLVGKLPDAEQQALWLQTDAGVEWLDEADAETAQVPVLLKDVVSDLYSKVWRRAADWEDDRLERYLSRQDGDEDFDEDDDDETDDESVADADEDIA